MWQLCQSKRAGGKNGENQTRPRVALCAVLRTGQGNDTTEAPNRSCWSYGRICEQRQSRTRETPVSSLHEDEVRQTGKGKAERKKQASHHSNIAAQGGGVKKEQEKGEAPKSGTYPGSQRPAEPVATGFFGGSNRAEKCGSVKEPWRQAVGRGCQIFPELSHSLRCQNRGCGNFLLSAGQV